MSRPIEGAMSFAEIGRELGISTAGAWMLYQYAIEKLRRPENRRKLEELRALARMKDSFREKG
jgi:DNA-directed RNA polymerase specialized sigma24 family protein